MNYTVIDGVISGLDRTTETSGGGDTMTTTTHISLFNLAGERVLLKTNTPAMIADGDHLKLAGVAGQGQFTAIACKNLSTGWTSPFKAQGCAKAAIIAFGLVGMVFTMLFPLFIFMPVFAGVVLFLLIRADSRIKKAHFLLDC